MGSASGPRTLRKGLLRFRSQCHLLGMLLFSSLNRKELVVVSASCFFPQVGTNLSDIMAHRKITIRELGGCMGPIWSSYYGNCRSLLVGHILFTVLGKYVLMLVLSSPRSHFV